MKIDPILLMYMRLWFITFPLTIFVLYKLITEMLDLILNTGKINRILKHSDSLRPELLEGQYREEKNRQNAFDQSCLKELERQINYIRLEESNSGAIFKNKVTKEKAFDPKMARWNRYLKGAFVTHEEEKIIAAKEVSDIFKVV